MSDPTELYQEQSFQSVVLQLRIFLAENYLMIWGVIGLLIVVYVMYKRIQVELAKKPHLCKLTKYNLCDELFLLSNSKFSPTKNPNSRSKEDATG